jgi:hypothetical protein
MKKFITTLLLSSFLSLPLVATNSHCQSLNPSTDITDVQFNTYLEQDKLAVQRASSIAVRVYVLSLDNQADRDKISSFIYRIIQRCGLPYRS